ncbi:DUF2283 domain-containing protein (plasmid) [Bacillus cereus]|uniref:DUF2283 domain-containing protein n=1 Tax=Bacillus cereus (strain ZK / E33L) TaxID=288681 RepID=Q4V119_BACCZ|nr:DUF2283 domain-containing protein [Bacillus cereus]AAY60588.1 conserved hypothetical protein [Bacillus cereus E33L]AJI26390.1 hypothetical protein BF28_5816 [Bacillus cereus E33L]QQA19002.1 DUF2283 domain-containing protein [Bacillus cereus]
MNLITYDKEAKMGYIHLIPLYSNSHIEFTDELDENPKIMLDIDNQGRIVGIELFGELSNLLKEFVKQKKIYRKKMYEDKKIYSFRINSNSYLKTISLKGITFYFADEMYKEFLGFDIVEIEPYDKYVLDSMSY